EELPAGTEIQAVEPGRVVLVRRRRWAERVEIVSQARTDRVVDLKDFVDDHGKRSAVQQDLVKGPYDLIANAELEDAHAHERRSPQIEALCAILFEEAFESTRALGFIRCRPILHAQRDLDVVPRPLHWRG